MYIYGKIVGTAKPVFIASHHNVGIKLDNLIWPVLASFEDEGHSYIMVVVDNACTSFRYKYVDDCGEDVILDTDLSVHEEIKTKAAFGILKVLAMKEDEECIDHRFITTVKTVINTVPENSDILEEIGAKTGLSKDTVTKLLMKICDTESDSW